MRVKCFLLYFLWGCLSFLCEISSCITYDGLHRRIVKELTEEYKVPLDQAESCARLIASLNDTAVWLDTNLAKTSDDSVAQNILDHFVIGAITSTCGHLKTKPDVGNGLMKSNNQTIVLDAEEKIREIYLLDDSEASKAKRQEFAGDVSAIFSKLFNTYFYVKCEKKVNRSRVSITVYINVFQGCEVDIESIASKSTIPMPTKIRGCEILVRKLQCGYGVTSVAPVINFVEK